MHAPTSAPASTSRATAAHDTTTGNRAVWPFRRVAPFWAAALVGVVSLPIPLVTGAVLLRLGTGPGLAVFAILVACSVGLVRRIRCPRCGYRFGAWYRGLASYRRCERCGADLTLRPDRLRPDTEREQDRQPPTQNSLEPASPW